MKRQEPRFHGPQPGYKDSKTHTKGIMRQWREKLHREANARNNEYRRQLECLIKQESVQIAEDLTK